jgi:hypothetical protein
MGFSRVRLLPLLCTALVFVDFASAQARTETLASSALRRILDLKGETYHVQGIDFEGDRLWVTSVDTAARKGYLQEFSLRTGTLRHRIEVQDGERFHPGGITVAAGSIWIPVAEYRPYSSSVIQRRNKRTLELEFSFRVPDHIGCVAIAGNRAIGGNWGSREFYAWDLRGNLLQRMPTPTENAYQDMKYDQGHLIASGLLPERAGAIDWLSFPDLRLLRRISVGNIDRGLPFTREGMAIRGERLLLLPEDETSRIFEFRLRK